MPTKKAGELGREELAWAAGFLDGEGYFKCSVNHHKTGNRTRRDFPSVAITAAQTATRVVLLHRLQLAVGTGKVYGPYLHKNSPTKPSYVWSVNDFEHVQYCVALLWHWLSPPKRAQARQALLKARVFQERPKIKPGPKRGA